MSTKTAKPRTPEHHIRRKGWHSSEFWLSVAVLVIPAILPSLDKLVGLIPTTSPWSIVAGALVAVGYAWSRGKVKASRNMASALEAGPREQASKPTPATDAETPQNTEVKDNSQ